MARITPRPGSPERGRQVQRRRSAWLVPVILAGCLVPLVGLGIWQLTRTTTANPMPQPIATLDTQDVHALLWSPTAPDTVFFGHHGGMLKSVDGGRTWQPTALTGVDAMSLAASPQIGERIYAAGHGVFRRSDDAGATWTAPPGQLEGADIHAFAQSPTDPDRLYALIASQGILTSADGGATWMPGSSAPAHAALAVSADGQRLLLGAEQGVQQSTDHGTTWRSLDAGLPRGAQVLALAVDPRGEAILAATSEGLYRTGSTDGIWTPTPLTGPVLAVAMSPAQPNVVLAIDDQQRVYRSDDGGTTW